MRPVLIRVGYDAHVDPFRPDLATWTGERLSTLAEVILRLDG
jgi:hypothetical protein